MKLKSSPSLCLFESNLNSGCLTLAEFSLILNCYIEHIIDYNDDALSQLTNQEINKCIKYNLISKRSKIIK